MVRVDYPAGDFLIRLKNAVIAGNMHFVSTDTKLIRSIADVLVKHGYLKGYGKIEEGLLVDLALHKRKPLIIDVKLVSRPGLRVYMDRSELEARRGPSVLIVTTNLGVMTDKDAIKKNLGGEVIAQIL
jgi:small subunit ribosomal protein S8